MLSYAYAVSGDKTRAKVELDKTLSEYPEQSPFHLARIYILLNNNSEALTRLEQAYEMRDIWMYNLKVDPTLDLIRNESRFIAIMKKMHLD